MIEEPQAVFRCNRCASPRLVYFRLDADWGLGGDMNRLNSDDFYEPNDPESRDEMDFSGTYCLACKNWN